jgi:hypothetical protein
LRFIIMEGKARRARDERVLSCEIIGDKLAPGFRVYVQRSADILSRALQLSIIFLLLREIKTHVSKAVA